MEATQHAQTRARQRGIPGLLLQIAQECGRQTAAPGGAQRIFCGRREAQHLRQELKRLLQMIDKAQGAALIVQNGRIITVYKQQSN